MKHATDHKGPPMNFDPNQIAQTLTASIRLSGAPQRRGGWQEPDDQGIVGSDGEPELG
jgi:hypothetical protein